MIFGPFRNMKKSTRAKFIRAFTWVFLVVFVISVAAALLITGLQAPVPVPAPAST
ncbi:MAG: hypothetical protein JOY86_08895 [Candidatus Eremiobacteraeota bacterium]|nr:hypothetical protein [Candidatus Eremiobacteraeota bacterium]